MKFSESLTTSFPTWKDESREILSGRLTLFFGSLILIIISVCFFQLKFQINSFWIFKYGIKKIQINIPYFLLIVLFILLIYAHLEALILLQIRRYTIPVNRLSNNSYIRIAHISDTHVHYPYPQITPKKLLKIVQMINKERVDCVLFTGDLISDHSPYVLSKDIPSIASALKELEAPVFVCFGNHDVDCQQSLIQALSEIKTVPVKVLDQQTVDFMVDHSRTQSSSTPFKIYISGIKPSLNLDETAGFINEIRANFRGDPNDCHILMAHMPDAADSASSSGLFDIQFSGHSHGGQCVLPLNSGTLYLPPGSKRYHGIVEANYRVGDMILTVSRGVGVTPLPFPLMRFLCPPEISIVTLIPSDNSIV